MDGEHICWNLCCLFKAFTARRGGKVFFQATNQPARFPSKFCIFYPRAKTRAIAENEKSFGDEMTKFLEMLWKFLRNALTPGT